MAYRHTFTLKSQREVRNLIQLYPDDYIIQFQMKNRSYFKPGGYGYEVTLEFHDVTEDGIRYALLKLHLKEGIPQVQTTEFEHQG